VSSSIFVQAGRRLWQLVVESLCASGGPWSTGIPTFPRPATGDSFEFTRTSRNPVDPLVISAIITAVPIRKDSVAVCVAECAVTLANVASISCEKGEEADGRTAMQRARTLVIEAHSHYIAVPLRDFVGHNDRLSDQFPTSVDRDSPSFGQFLSIELRRETKGQLQTTPGKLSS
jgi:hypothetical protein